MQQAAQKLTCHALLKGCAMDPVQPGRDGGASTWHSGLDETAAAEARQSPMHGAAAGHKAAPDSEAAHELISLLAEHPVVGSCLLCSALMHVQRACQTMETLCAQADGLVLASEEVNTALDGFMLAQVCTCTD